MKTTAPRKSLMTPTQGSASTATLLTADEAAQRLGVRKATLYAYVSRGRLSAVADPADPRARRYSSFEVEMAGRRQSAGRQREQQTLAALNEGWPVLDTALSCVWQGQPIYRGHSVLALAQTASVEDVARLLWQLGPHDPFDAPAPDLGEPWKAWARQWRGQHTTSPPLAERTLALMALALPRLHGPLWLADGAPLALACGQHLRAAMACFLCQAPQATPLHRQFVRAWRLPPHASEPLRQALVMAADHEMNMLAFTARGLASVGASLGAAMLAGLCNSTATFNGGATAQVEALWDEVTTQPQLQQALSRRLDRGEGLPGFNHLSYPAGDPRAQALLATCAALGPLPPIAAAVHKLTGWKPSIDFALVAMRRSLGAPAESALAVQMAGRCVGLLAHILEQRRSGQRIVVKARYVGPAPTTV